MLQIGDRIENKCGDCELAYADRGLRGNVERYASGQRCSVVLLLLQVWDVHWGRRRRGGQVDDLAFLSWRVNWMMIHGRWSWY